MDLSGPGIDVKLKERKKERKINVHQRAAVKIWGTKKKKTLILACHQCVAQFLNFCTFFSKM
jgi:hypothetical protein